jgi:glycosyltransferase involved in cell wall biosynthesis
MKLTFVIPAYNEAAWIERCLQHIAAAVDVCRAGRGHVFNESFNKDFDVEYIVTDNNSTDDTAQRAADAGVTVVFEPVNQISRARNTGARAATGDWLVFIDADCELSAGLLGDLLELINAGEHVGCGSLVAMNEMPRLARRLLKFWTWLSVKLNWAAGSFVACRADVFAALGGFNEELFVAEEIDFSRRIKKYARQQQSKFTVLRNHPLQTSNRKVSLYSEQELRAQILRLFLRPRKTMRDKAALAVWYDGRR